ncbi:cell growth-regulating nucleolar protein isoform X1 [Ictalurus punctatus]|uniref:Cell growth-regulating nucleolar protein n=1 Tax=Ictalurus punctatus TaxID=7998 RepID=A0A2D0QDQ9_ICTPU|nr:cell growth-regulating nucleolar protein isoform X1 [Ictalurus punctatus]
MVFFTCNACGESLKKAQIQKHISMCRGCRVLSCIDCGKDFWGEDYKSHVKCISEDQKYGGKNYEAKANKGDVKQQQWIQRVQAALDKPGVSARLRTVLQQVATYDNVPRKKAKFQNWIQNSLRIYDSSLQNQVWEIFSSSDSPQPNKAEQPEPTSPPAPAVQEEQVKPDEKKKNKRERKEERQKKSKKKRTENGDTDDKQNGVEEPQKKKKRKQAAEECDEEVESMEGKSSKKKKQRKEEECEESQDMEEVEEEKEAQEESKTKGKFNWKGTIKAVLRQAPEEGIALKKLRKKVLSAYYSFSEEDNHKSEDELYSLFNKKLKNPKFKILKDKVRLVQ